MKNNQQQRTVKQRLTRPVLLALLLLSQPWLAPGLEAQPLPDRRQLSGAVKGADGQPLARAVVTLRRQDELNAVAFWGAQAVTNARGEFNFPDAEEGAYYVTVEAPGFAPLHNSSHRLSQTSAPLQVTLVRLATLPLRVLKPDGSPLVKGKIVVRLRGGGASGQRAVVTATTDAAGTLQKSDLIPGAYSLHAVASGVGYAILNNVNVKYSAQPESVEVHLKTGGMLRVTARETTGDGVGRPLGGATFTVMPVVATPAANPDTPSKPPESALVDAHSNPYASITRDGDGIAEASNLAPGRYTVRLLLPSYETGAAQTVEIKERETALANFELKRQGSLAALEVLVRNSKGEPIADADFSLQLRPHQGGATTVTEAPPAPPDAPPGVVRAFAGSLRRARSDSSGRIVLYPVKPGNWTVGPPMRGLNVENPPTMFNPARVTVTDKGGTVTITLPK